MMRCENHSDVSGGLYHNFLTCLVQVLFRKAEEHGLFFDLYDLFCFSTNAQHSDSIRRLGYITQKMTI